MRTIVLVVGFPAAAFGTNCYVVAPAAGEQCVVIDPGIEVIPTLDEVLREHRLQPVAVLLTHGHLDHTFSVTPVCNARDVPAWIHPGDLDLLADPMMGLSVDTKQIFGGRLEWTEPSDVRTLVDGATLDLAGLSLRVEHAPGHTRGSVAFMAPASGEMPEVMFSGDLLFQGSIGRTDLPGGSYAQMLESLARVVLTKDDSTVVLSGHGDRTTVGRERATNPFLAEAAPIGGPSRGM